MDEFKMLTVIITAVVTGAISAIGTVAALRVHILYIRERLTEHHERFNKMERAIERAHERLDEMEHTRHE